jgi:hypothetical protein
MSHCIRSIAPLSFSTAKKPRPEADFRRRQPQGHEFELLLQVVFVATKLQSLTAIF